MSIAIIYSSNTGNTEKVAEAIRQELKDKDIVYFGKPTEEIPDADIYLLGSWTDKGDTAANMTECIQKIKNKKIAFFGTAGYGGSEEYYKTLFERVKKKIDPSNQILGSYYCQGKMPIQVRERYVKMMTQNPEDRNLQVNITNFDEALSHPDETDLQRAKEWIRDLWKSI